MLFNVTYEIITKDSSEQGEAEEMGFIAENVKLREAIENVLETRTSHCEGVHGVDVGDSWATIYNGIEFTTGAYENRSIHYPENITGASIGRIAKLLNA